MKEEFNPEIELSKVLLANVLLGPFLFGGIRRLKTNNELVLVSAVYNNEGNNFYITIKQLLQYLQKTYNEGKPCRDLKDIKRCFSDCLNDLYKEYGARFLGIDGFCAYLYTKMYDIIEKNQLFKINFIKEFNTDTLHSFIEKDVNAETLHFIDIKALSKLFSDNDVNFKCDTKTYVIDNYPISQQEQEKVFNDFKEKPWVLYIKDNDIYNNDNKIKNLLSSDVVKHNDDKIETIINDPQFDNGILIFNQKKVIKEYTISGSKKRQFYPPLGGHIIKHIVQQAGLKKSAKYCSGDNFVHHQCKFKNDYGSCNFIESSFAVEEDGIYDVEDEEKQKLQQGEKINLKGKKIPAISHYKLESCVDKRCKEEAGSQYKCLNKNENICSSKEIIQQDDSADEVTENKINVATSSNENSLDLNSLCDLKKLKCNGKWCGCF